MCYLACCVASRSLYSFPFTRNVTNASLGFPYITSHYLQAFKTFQKSELISFSPLGVSTCPSGACPISTSMIFHSLNALLFQKRTYASLELIPSAVFASVAFPFYFFHICLTLCMKPTSLFTTCRKLLCQDCERL